jgi:hypothetical protein
MTERRIPILTYHGNGINGRTYETNDLLALQADLQLLSKLGWQVISIDQLLDWMDGQITDEAVEKAVVLTCDDGTWFDYHDLNHPHHGPQQSLFTTLVRHQQASGQPVHMTNFVIVSPEARVILDQRCLVGRGWWGDDWWQAAEDSGLMSIANHSWDHNHGVLDNNNINDDSFRDINDWHSCDRQIRQAQDFLRQKLGGEYRCHWFAYPYGNYSEYLRHQYLPEHGQQIGLRAAFTTDDAYVSKNTERWAIPRFVCNHHWQSTAGLEQILSAA